MPSRLWTPPHVFWRCEHGDPDGIDGSMSAETTLLDLTGAEDLCTQPGALDRVRTAYANLEPEGRLEVWSPIAEHTFAVRAWSRKQGVRVVLDEPAEGFRRIVLERPTAGG